MNQNHENKENDDFFTPIFMPVAETNTDTAPFPQNSQNSQNTWEAVIPFGNEGSDADMGILPSIEPNLIPPMLRDYVLDCANHYQTAFEMPLFCALACLATAVQGKYQIEIKEDYVEPLNLYIIITAEPSELKSPTLKRFKKPLEEWEIDKNKEEAFTIQNIKSKNKTLEKLIEGKRAKASKITDFALLNELAQEIIELEQELINEPHFTRLFADDVTPESLGVVLENQGGKLAIAEAEGGFFSILAGRYSKGVPNLDLILKAYNGENVRIDRKGFKSIFIENPCLTLLFLIQPYLLKNRENSEAFKGRGLDARFLYIIPSSKIGYRTFMNAPINKAHEQLYNGMIKHYLNTDLQDEKPYTLRMEQEALMLYAKFMDVLEKSMREGNELENMRDWAGKKGTLGRIVGLLHCASFLQPQNEKIQVQTVQNACAIMTSLIAHAKQAYGFMFDNEELQVAKKILSWIKNARKQSFSARDCFQGVRVRTTKQEEINKSLIVLEEHGYIRKLPLLLVKNIGRPPSVRYEVHPSLRQKA